MSDLCVTIGPNGCEAMKIALLLALSGALGGFAVGVNRAPKPITINLFGRPRSCGVLGDMVIGVAAALAVYFAADKVFDIGGMVGAGRHMTVIGVGVLSGFLGIRLLSTLGDAFLSKVDRLGKELETMKEAGAAREKVNEGLLLMERDPKGAVELFKEALREEPDNRFALLSLSRAYKRMGEYGKAIQAVDRLLALVPGHAWGLYCRAIYCKLKGELEYAKDRGKALVEFDTALAQLKKAVKNAGNFGNKAADDPDFTRWNDVDVDDKEAVQRRVEDAAKDDAVLKDLLADYLADEDVGRTIRSFWELALGKEKTLGTKNTPA